MMQANQGAQQNINVLEWRKSVVPEDSPIPLARMPVQEKKNPAPTMMPLDSSEKKSHQPAAQAEPVNSNYKRARSFFVLLIIFLLALGLILSVVHWFAALVYLLAMALVFAVLKRTKPELFGKLKKPKQPQKAELEKQDFVEVIDSVFKVDTMLVSQNLSSVIQILINKASFVIGSQAATCDFALTMDSSISRKHFRIVFAKMGGRTAYYIEDLGSRNGTVLNGQRLAPGEPHSIQYGDQITISGKFNFIVRSTSY